MTSLPGFDGKAVDKAVLGVVVLVILFVLAIAVEVR